MIQLFEEDYELVKKGVSVGSEVSTELDPVTGYVDGNVYINIDTLDVFKCNGTGWIKEGNLKGIANVTMTESSEDGGDNILKISLTDGREREFIIKNGKTGKGISNISTIESDEDEGINRVTVSMTDGTEKSFNVKNGSKGTAAGFGTVTASVDSNIGIPSVEVESTGSNTQKSFDFIFKNLKGEKATL